MLGPMEFSWNEVADKVWYTVTPHEDANVVCIAGDERAMLVDAGATAEVGAAVLASANQLAGVPVTHVVISHHHFDHWHGLAGMEGVESIGHRSLVADDTPEELRLTHPISLARGVQLGERYVEIVHFGPAHTAGDLVVVVQDAGVMVVGDLLESAGEPQFDEDTDFGGWVGVLDSVIGTSMPNTVFVPGHGEPKDREFAFLQSGDMAILHSTTENLIRQGIKLDAAYDAVDEWPFSEQSVRKALPLIYAELKEQGVEPRTQLPLAGFGPTGF